jgi:hypothetical protein
MGGIFLYRSRCFWVVEYIWSECIGGSNIYIRYELSLGYAIRVDGDKFWYGVGDIVY